MGVSPRLILSLVLATAAGCVPGKFMVMGPAPTIAPASIVAAWSPKVHYTPDPARGGVPAPGIAGRIYLFGPAGDFPIIGDGTMTVDLYDDTPVNGQPANTHIERWEFDPETLRRLAKRDTVGMGYTLFLPWGTHRPDLKSVHLSVKYETTGMTPIYAPSGTLTLDHGTPPSGTTR